MSLARAYKRRAQAAIEATCSTLLAKPYNKGGPSTRAATSSPQGTTTVQTTPAVVATPAVHTGAKAATIVLVVSLATSASSRAPQMEEHKRLSLCYNCEEKYTSNHACKQLFYIELVNDTPTTATEIATPDPEISLHTLTGISTGQTM